MITENVSMCGYIIRIFISMYENDFYEMNSYKFYERIFSVQRSAPVDDACSSLAITERRLENTIRNVRKLNFKDHPNMIILKINKSKKP